MSRRNRGEVLKILRTSGAGDRIVLGTVSHRAVRFGLRHMTWISGIHCGLDEGADANRFLQFEMRKPASHKKGQWKMPDPALREAWGRNLTAIATRYAYEAAWRAQRIYRRCTDRGVHERTVEALAAPAAILGAAAGRDDDQTATVLEDFVQMARSESDDIPLEAHSELMAAILDIQIDAGGGHKHSVSAILLDDNQRLEAECSEQAAEQAGVSIKPWKGTDWLVIDPARVARKIPECEVKSVRQLLKRIPEAIMRNAKILGATRYCVWIPMDSPVF